MSERSGGRRACAGCFLPGASCVLQVGDRIFTDVLYGNRNGTLTVLCEPLAPHKDPPTVKKVRKRSRGLWRTSTVRGALLTTREPQCDSSSLSGCISSSIQRLGVAAALGLHPRGSTEAGGGRMTGCGAG